MLPTEGHFLGCLIFSRPWSICSALLGLYTVFFFLQIAVAAFFTLAVEMFLVMGKFRLHRRLFHVPGMINFRCDGRSETKDENSSYDNPPPSLLKVCTNLQLYFCIFTGRVRC